MKNFFSNNFVFPNVFGKPSSLTIKKTMNHLGPIDLPQQKIEARPRISPKCSATSQNSGPIQARYISAFSSNSSPKPKRIELEARTKLNQTNFIQFQLTTFAWYICIF